MVPSLVLIFLVLGTIFMGLATPTEAGARWARRRHRAGGC
jgi:TRAP-type mannitol/chloroaromatic compound transport system permease large subunit